MRFQNPQYLYLLFALIPLFVGFVVYMLWRKRAMQRLGDLEMIENLMPGLAKGRLWIKAVLFHLAIAAVMIGIANPQIGSKPEKVKSYGIDLMIAIDVSKSMLAQDVKPDRLERTLQVCQRLIDRLQNDRVGLIIFGSKAYIQMPLTKDHSAAKIFLQTINTDLVPSQGTAIAEAIRLACESFPEGDKANRAILLISDGEDHEASIEEALKKAGELGVRIMAMGAGTPEGAPIPVYRGGQQVDFKRDRNNQIIITKLNEQVLADIAGKTGGTYFRLGSGDPVGGLVRALSDLEKEEREVIQFAEYVSYFPYFFGLALLLLVLEWLINEKRSYLLRRLRIFNQDEEN